MINGLKSENMIQFNHDKRSIFGTITKGVLELKN